MIHWGPHLPALQVVVPMACASLTVLLRPRGLAWAAATLTSALAFAIAVVMALGVADGHIYRYAMGGWPAPYGIALEVDAFSALILLVITGASTAALLGAQRSIDRDIDAARQPLFYAAWLLAVAGLAGIAVSGDAFNIFVFMEISSLASYVLISGGSDRRALPAVFKYLVMGTIGATFYLIGIGLIYMMTGTLNLADMESRIATVADQRPILVAAGFITTGLALKAAVFPLHVWLPNAYTYAPHAVTAFLAACATKVAIYVLLRFDFFVFQQHLSGHELQFVWFLMPLAVLAILVASAVAIQESNIKRLLAWSSVAQVGYIMLGASLVSIPGLTAAIVHLFNHGLAKLALFLAVAGFARRATSLEVASLAGIGRHMPMTALAFVVAGFSLIGIPGTAGFISKWYLLMAVLDAGALTIPLIAVIAAGSLMAVVYIWRIAEQAFFASLPAADAPVQGSEVSVLLAITWTAVLGNLYFGLFPSLPLDLSATAAGLLLEHRP